MQYFRTVLTIEVLTAREAFNGNVEDLAETITTGEASGMELVRVVEALSEHEVEQLLIAHGSDPSFLTGVEDEDDDLGYDLTDDEDGTPHDARPDDDTQPGSRCKDCGKPVTWVGPSHTDWEHVDEPPRG